MTRLRYLLGSLLLVFIFLAVSGLATNVNAKEIPWFHNQKTIVSWKNVVLPEGSTVKHLIVIGGDATVNGRVNDEVVVIDGDVTIGSTGYVKDNVTAVGGTVKQESGSFVGKASCHLN